MNFENYVEQDLLLNEEGTLAISPKHFMEKKDTNFFHFNLAPAAKNELVPKKLFIFCNFINFFLNIIKFNKLNIKKII